MGQGAKERGDGGSDVCMSVSMSRYVCLCMCNLKGNKSQDKAVEGGKGRRGGEEGKGSAKAGVNRQGLGFGGGTGH